MAFERIAAIGLFTFFIPAIAFAEVPQVPWEGDNVELQGRVVFRALRSAGRTAFGGRGVNPRAIDFQKDEAASEEPRVVLTFAKRNALGTAAVALFRVGTISLGHDELCPDLWIARLSRAEGSRSFSVDSAQRLYEDVCGMGESDGESRIVARIVSSRRGPEGNLRLKIDADIRHHSVCVCGSVQARFEAYFNPVQPDLLVTTLEENPSGCYRRLKAWLAFEDRNGDGLRDYVLRERFSSRHGADGECTEDASRRVNSVDEVDSAETTCVHFVRRTERLWDAAAGTFGPPRSIALVD